MRFQRQIQNYFEENIKTSFSNGKINGKKLPVADGINADIAIVVVKNTDNDDIGKLLQS